MRRAVDPLLVLLLATMLFLAWMHPAVLWPTNFGWLLAGEDRGQTALGLAAYLRAGSWSLHQPLLLSPEGATLLFTDSVPLLGVLGRPFAAWLPAGVQAIGPWYALCMLLQVGFAALLLRPHLRGAVARWTAVALLAAMPALFNRYGHPSLCAQWLLLWSLWIFVDPRRADRALWWAAVLTVAALVHSYLLLMVAAVWGSALLEGSVRRRDPRAAATMLIALLPAAGVLWLLGAFGGPYGSTHSYGQFPAALDAWWNPANPGYTALPFSSPAMPQGRGFEGFNYLGAGLIALVLIAVWRWSAGRVGDPERPVLRRLAWLLPVLLVLALVAIGPAPVWRGEALAWLALPGWLVDALDPVRASGRLLWPATYMLAFAALLCVAGSTRATLLLVATAALQVVDLAPMLGAVRATSARATDPRVFTRTADPRWSALVAAAGDVQFDPAEPFRDLQLVQEVSWRAVLACRPVRYTYTSRVAADIQRRLARDAADFAAGRLDPARLYVILGDKPAPAAVAPRVRYLDGVRLIPPARPGPPGPCGAAPRGAP